MTPESRAFIDGKLINAKSGKMFDNISPVSEDVIGQAADCSTEDMDMAINAARRLLIKLTGLSIMRFRLHCLHSFAMLCLMILKIFVAKSKRKQDHLMAFAGYGPQCDVPIGFIDTSLKLIENYKWSINQGLAASGRLTPSVLLKKSHWCCGLHHSLECTITN